MRIAILLAAALAVAAAHAQSPREIYAELVSIRTVHPDGDNTAAASAMAKRLLAAGFDPADVQVLEAAPKKGNLVARYRGTGAGKPILLLAHIDVVDAKREDWSDGLDPFTLTERDGFYYGRGSLDDKAMAAIYVANFIRLKREGWKPARDVIIALTCDEEGGTHNGMGFLIERHRGLIDAEFALNEGAEGQLVDGRPVMMGVQVAEKLYQSYEIEATNRGGHSSLPRADNAIYDLARALDRISRHAFPAHVGATAKQVAARLSTVAEPALRPALAAIAAQRATDEDLRAVAGLVEMNAQLRTTCVATRIEGGQADNALPQRAMATVNCRLLPGEDDRFVAAELKRVAGEGVQVRPKNPVRASPATPIDAAPYRAIERAAAATWPGVKVFPTMSEGATDGSRLRNIGIPVYGVTGLFLPLGESRMHGRDERLPVKSFEDGLAFHLRLLRELASPGGGAV